MRLICEGLRLSRGKGPGRTGRRSAQFAHLQLQIVLRADFGRQLELRMSFNSFLSWACNHATTCRSPSQRAFQRGGLRSNSARAGIIRQLVESEQAALG